MSDNNVCGVRAHEDERVMLTMCVACVAWVTMRMAEKEEEERESPKSKNPTQRCGELMELCRRSYPTKCFAQRASKARLAAIARSSRRGTGKIQLHTALLH